MGFRADFYLGRGSRALWLGSLRDHGTPKHLNYWLKTCFDQREFYAGVYEITFSLPDGVQREQGWPWQYATSQNTDYVYAYDDNQLFVSCYGSPWVPLKDLNCASIIDDYDFDNLPGATPVWPDMHAAGLACV